MTAPPRVWRALLRLVASRRHRDDIDGDLIEWYQRQAATDAVRARRGYRRLVLATLVDRLRISRSTLGRRLATHHPESDERSPSMFDTTASDVRHGFRAMRAAPTQAVTGTLTLALAIGAMTVVAVIVHTFLFRPLAYRDADRVLFLLGWNTEAGQMRFGIAPGDFVDLRRDLTGVDKPLTDAAAYQYWDATLTGGAAPTRAQGYRVTPNTFGLLGVAPLLGRTFDQSDVDAGRRPIVISHALWRRLFGAAPDVIGRDVVIDGLPRVIVAVMPAAFEFPVLNFKGDLWAPLVLDPAVVATNRSAGGTVVAIGRLDPAVSLDRAQTAASAVMSRLAETYPRTNEGVGVRVMPMAELGRRDARAPLFALGLVVGLLLVAATASVATMAIARGVARRQELAVRTALGARPGQLVRLLAWEGLLPVLAGGAIGLGIASFALAALRRLLPDHLVNTVPNVDSLRLGPDAWTLAAVTTVVAAVLAAAWPAWRAGRSIGSGTEVLTSRSVAGLPTRRLTSGLVVAEIAVSMVLVVSALLLARTMRAAAVADLGFTASDVTTFSLSTARERYPEPAARTLFFNRVLAELSAVPGVRAAGAVNVLPFSTADSRVVVHVEGQGQPTPGQPSAGLRIASPGYAAAAGLRLIEGRFLGEADVAGAAPVAVVNRTSRSTLPSDRPALGARVRLGTAPTAPWLTVVGVVDDVRHDSIAESPRAEVYVPMAQSPPGAMMLAVRTASGIDTTTIEPAIARAVHRIDPDQPIFGLQPFAARVRVSLFVQQLLAWLMGAFAITAGLVAFAGLYGLVSYAVARDTPEFRVRLALGAPPSTIRVQVLGRAVRLAALGVAIGLAAAWGVASLLAAVLIGVPPHDPVAFGLAIALALCGTVVAATGPARQAGRTSAVIR